MIASGRADSSTFNSPTNEVSLPEGITHGDGDLFIPQALGKIAVQVATVGIIFVVDNGDARCVFGLKPGGYMELLSEGGVVGVVLFASFLAAVAWKSYRSFLRRQGRYSVMLYAGAASGIVSMLIFSITDFNLHIGANALYFFFLTALAVSAAHTSARVGRTDTYLDRSVPVTNRLVIPSLALMLLSMAFDAGGLMARSGLPSLQDREATMPTLPRRNSRKCELPRRELPFLSR